MTENVYKNSIEEKGSAKRKRRKKIDQKGDRTKEDKKIDTKKVDHKRERKKVDQKGDRKRYKQILIKLNSLVSYM